LIKRYLVFAYNDNSGWRATGVEGWLSFQRDYNSIYQIECDRYCCRNYDGYDGPTWGADCKWYQVIDTHTRKWIEMETSEGINDIIFDREAEE